MSSCREWLGGSICPIFKWPRLLIKNLMLCLLHSGTRSSQPSVTGARRMHIGTSPQVNPVTLCFPLFLGKLDRSQTPPPLFPVWQDVKQGWRNLRSYFCCVPSADTIEEAVEPTKSGQGSKWGLKGLSISNLLPRILTGTDKDAIASVEGPEQSEQKVATPVTAGRSVDAEQILILSHVILLLPCSPGDSRPGAPSSGNLLIRRGPAFDDQGG